MKRSDEILSIFKTVCGDRYILEDRVGGGSFGDVFMGREVGEGGKRYAIKFEKKTQYVYQTLPKEAKVLSIMENEVGYAQLKEITAENGFNILVMNLLGANLEKLFKYCEGKPNVLIRKICFEDGIDDGNRYDRSNRTVSFEESHPSRHQT